MSPAVAATSSTFDASALTAVRSVGAALPMDVVTHVVTGTDLPGLGSDDYHLEFGLTPREAANRSWAVLSAAWTGYRDALASTPEPATRLTREKWLSVVLRELGFGRVPPTPAGGLVADGRSWPVSHLAAGDVPAHLLGWNVELDRKTPGLAGAAERAPHAMVQDLLNRADEYLWAIVSNGAVLRLLRDSSSLVGPSYVEFDLAAIFDGELFSDFVVFYLICHQSRFEPTDPDTGVGSCWLEQWRTHAAEAGIRALGDLRTGVHDAIEAIGTGLVSHPENTALRRDLADGKVSASDLQHAVTRLVYRVIFCFVAEDRGQLLDPDADQVTRERYQRWFSTARLRQISRTRRGDRHSDLWQGLRLVLGALGREEGCPQLGLAGLGGLFEPGPADRPLADTKVDNRHLLEAIRHLNITRAEAGGPRRVVDYRHLGAEELGGIYENLLQFVPQANRATGEFTLTTLAGNERKKSGAYYTPTSLTETLLDSALDPLLDRAATGSEPEAGLLDLKVCDPACGSGHFLVAAARRIAGRLATLRAEGSEPTETQMQEAMRDVVARCIYGVDVNPQAAELAKVGLWLEGMTAGQALSLLDGHIRVGNALLGTTPALLAGGIPDEAFNPIEGDDRKIAATLKKQNRREQVGHNTLFAPDTFTTGTATLARAVEEIDRLTIRSLTDLHVAERRLRDHEQSPEAQRARLIADAWCAAFVIEKASGKPALTQAALERIATGTASEELVKEVGALQARYRFFHWHLEFPQIFTAATDATANPVTGWGGGFDLVIGNPPWERVKLQEQEWFATRQPAIAEAPNAAVRKKLIAALADEQPELYGEFIADRRQAEGESHLIRNSGRYPLAGRGDVNTYAVFAETDRSLIAPTGRLGLILPTGIATDATTQYFFKDLVTSKALVSLYDFENRDKIFEAVDSRVKFCLLTLTGRAAPADVARFAFFTHHPRDLARDGAIFTLTPEEITLLNPNTGTCPVFRTRRDAEITLGIYRRHPVLIKKDDPDGNPWGVSFMTMFHMSNDSGLFHTRDQLEADGWTLDGNTFHRGDEAMLPLYEAKMVHHYDHRWATYTDSGGDVRDTTDTEHADPDFVVLPRYWVTTGEVDARLEGRWNRPWLLGFRNVCRATDERTIIAGQFPLAGVGNSMPVILTQGDSSLLAAVLTSIAADFAMRQKLGGTNMNFFYVEQLPAPSPEDFTRYCSWSLEEKLNDWFEDRIDELVYSAYDIAPMGIALGDDGQPFVWNPDRRAVVRAELDAAFFHLYGLNRDDTEYVLSTFPIANRRDPELAGRVLDAYDAIAKAIESGTPFVSTLDPAPGQGPRHPERA